MPASAFSRARSHPTGSSTLVGTVSGVVSGLLLPLGIIVAGLAMSLLQTEANSLPVIANKFESDFPSAPETDAVSSQSPVMLGRLLAVPLPRIFLDQEPLTRFMILALVGTSIALAQVFFLWILYGKVFARSRDVVTGLHRATMTRCIEHASSEGVTAQRRRAEQLIQFALPEVRKGLIAWYRAIPRSIVVVVSCVMLAILVDVWLAMLAVISAILIWRLYRWLGGMDEPASSHWELPKSRDRLVEMVQEAPMLARLQRGEEFDAAYLAQLEQVMDLQGLGDNETIRGIPVLSVAVILAVGMLAAALGVNVLTPESVLTLPASLVLAMSLAGAGFAASRLFQTQRIVEAANDAAEAIYSFLDAPTRNSASERLGIAGLNDAIELSGVTLRDGQQNVLANDISLRFEPGTMVALLGSDHNALKAIVELLLGFGRPATGKATLDGMAITDIHAAALGKQVVWVGRDGPIWNGTIEENLRANTDNVTLSDLADVTRKVGIYDKIQQLEDSFTTEIAVGDSRFEERGLHAIAMARALLTKPAVIIVEEPAASQSDLTDDPCLDALIELVNGGTLVIVLPRRLRTLRKASRVVLLSKGHIAGEGKHEQLLASSDLYRHLNYQLFNPYRDV